MQPPMTHEPVPRRFPPGTSSVVPAALRLMRVIENQWNTGEIRRHGPRPSRAITQLLAFMRCVTSSISGKKEPPKATSNPGASIMVISLWAFGIGQVALRTGESGCPGP